MAERSAVAAIDCGTNSVRLLVLDRSGRELGRRMKVTRLGEGVGRTGRLSDDAIDRTLGALAEYRQEMDSHGVGPVAASATAAARDATNSAAFLGAAEEVIGVPLRVLSGKEEGALSFSGATSALSAGEPVTVFDVGGGSTELVSGRPGEPPHTVVSLPVGCVRLTERFLHHDPPTEAEVELATREADEIMAHAVAEHPDLARNSALIGLAGTVTTLAALALGLDRYERRLVHRSTLTLEQIFDWTQKLAGEAPAERRRNGLMEPGRADVIVGGAIAVAAVMKATQADRCTVSESDILDGMAATLLAPNGMAGDR